MSAGKVDDDVYDYEYAFRNSLKRLDESEVLSARDKELIHGFIEHLKAKRVSTGRLAKYAFAALPKGTVDGLLKDIPKLSSILIYHVVPGRVSASDVMNMTKGKTVEVKTVQGQPVTLKTQGMFSKSVYVNNAKVVKADIGTTNGVIHVIDKVIMPKT